MEDVHAVATGVQGQLFAAGARRLAVVDTIEEIEHRYAARLIKEVKLVHPPAPVLTLSTCTIHACVVCRMPTFDDEAETIPRDGMQHTVIPDREAVTRRWNRSIMQPFRRRPMRERPYMRLAILLVAGVAILFAAGYAMVEKAEHLHFNPHQLYVALMAMAPIGVLLLFLLGEAFPNRRVNAGLGAVFAVIFVGAFVGARTQAGIGDDAFLGAMISHHSQAITACGNGNLKDARILAFCERMTADHRDEIARLEAIIAAR